MRQSCRIHQNRYQLSLKHKSKMAKTERLGRMEKAVLDAWPLARMWVVAQQVKRLPNDPHLAFCYDVLNKVSRSFAIVIQQLPHELRDSVCIFYLVLRALDTIEDDMAVPVNIKVPALRSMHEKLEDRQWTMQCGTKEYARFMSKYPRVTEVYLKLPASHKEAIRDIAERMGKGMAEFIERDVKTVKDYDLYCHYVAGLVGVGLSKLFSASKLESPEFASLDGLSNDMGLFLQKINIIRDYLEDIMEEPAPRMFWPEEIWGAYARDLSEFKLPANSQKAVQALNQLVTDALRHALPNLEYMSKLRNQGVFRFCAIPQVMAIATLAEVYNNPKVFTGVVKVRRGVVARYLICLNDYWDLLRAFLHFSNKIAIRCKTEAAGDPLASATTKAALRIAEQAAAELKEARQPFAAKFSWPEFLTRLLLLLLCVSLAVRLLSALGLSNGAAMLAVSPIGIIALLLLVSACQRV